MTSRPAVAPGCEQRAVGLDRSAQLRDVVAEHFAEAAGLEEVALHVDDQQRRAFGVELELIGFGGDGEDLRHAETPVCEGGDQRMRVRQTLPSEPRSIAGRRRWSSGAASALARVPSAVVSPEEDLVEGPSRKKT